MSIDKVFVYGTLLTNERYFSALQGKIADTQDAHTIGAVVFHDTGEKPFPFLVYDEELLKTLEAETGIAPYHVPGELSTIKDESLLGEIDELEKIVLEEEDTADAPIKQPLVNIYKRMVVDAVTSDGTHHEAWAWVASPQKDHSVRLVEKRANRVIVPGDWRKYWTERSEDSLNCREFEQTFGMETEYTLFVQASSEIPLQSLSKRPKRKIRTEDRKITKGTIPTLLSRLLYSAVTSDQLGIGVLRHYAERDPVVNLRFLMPFGMAYVDGADHPDGTTIGIRRLIPEEQLTDHLHAGVQAPAIQEMIPPEDLFFETVGFPVIVEKGFAARAVRDEFVRRYYLAKAVEEIVDVLHGDKRLPVSRLAGHSTQYNIILDPTIEGSDSRVLDLSRKLSHVSLDGSSEQRMVSKFTHDVAYVLSRTFGPLITYFLSGAEQSHIEFKTRDGNRLEFRSSVVDDPAQLAAGIAVYTAAVRTVESIIKRHVLKVASQRLGASSEELLADEKKAREVLNSVYKPMTPDEFLGSFPFVVPVLEKPSYFRPGFRIDATDSYQGALYKDVETEIDVSIRGEMQRLPLRGLLEKLYHYPPFNLSLEQITTSQEFERIEDFIDRADAESQYSNNPPSMVTRRLWNLYDKFTLRPLNEWKTNPKDYPDGRSFSEFVTSFLFLHRGMYRSSDDKHQVEISLPEIYDEEGAIRIGAVPVQVTLSTKKDGNLTTVDTFVAALSPEKVRTLRTAISALEGNIPGYTHWQVYMKLK